MVLRGQKVKKNNQKDSAGAKLLLVVRHLTMVGKELCDERGEHEPITGDWGGVPQSRGNAPGRRGWVRAKPSEAESFGGPLADIVRFTNLQKKLSILRASKGNGKFVNFSVISRQGNGRILVSRF